MNFNQSKSLEFPHEDKISQENNRQRKISTSTTCYSNSQQKQIAAPMIHPAINNGYNILSMDGENPYNTRLNRSKSVTYRNRDRNFNRIDRIDESAFEKPTATRKISTVSSYNNHTTNNIADGRKISSSFSYSDQKFDNVYSNQYMDTNRRKSVASSSGYYSYDRQLSGSSSCYNNSYTRNQSVPANYISTAPVRKSSVCAYDYSKV